ncbi:hypothetical protein RB195_023407 [Necator americanus]|uniref:Cyclic nucleotide-binding domain-containing protein n=1 Tax=Necator americanus TaxID=51031 RepID=A0ABR1EJ17_NECAM
MQLCHESVLAQQKQGVHSPNPPASLGKHKVAFGLRLAPYPPFEDVPHSLVELSHLPDMYDPKAGVPRPAKLYTKQEYSEKFILILEGRALVTIGQDEMTFEAGPWHAFGTEMLERLMVYSECDSKSMVDMEFSRISLTTESNRQFIDLSK